MEKLYRDAKIYELCPSFCSAAHPSDHCGLDEGTSQIQRLIVSRHLSALYPA
jgi:acyl-CoA dehydrogenase